MLTQYWMDIKLQRTLEESEFSEKFYHRYNLKSSIIQLSTFPV